MKKLSLFGGHRLISAILPVQLALWPVWMWYWQRISDRSDEPFGLVALLTVVLLRWLGYDRKPSFAGDERESQSTAIPKPKAAAVVCGPMHLAGDGDSNGSCRSQQAAKGGLFSASVVVRKELVLIALLFLYCLSVVLAPQLFSLLLGVIILGVCLHSRHTRMLPGEWILLLLSLPVVATLNFYVSYPLRLAVCWSAVALLKISGFACNSAGTSLAWNGQIVDIDPPCSGIKMMWLALYVTVTVAIMRRLTLLPLVVLLFCSMVAAVVANVVRISSLFLIETGSVQLPVPDNVMHQGIGLIVFIFFVGLFAFFITKIPSTATNSSTAAQMRSMVTPLAGQSSQIHYEAAMHSGKWIHRLRSAAILPQLRFSPRRCREVLLVICLLAGSLPFIRPNEVVANCQKAAFPGWPRTFEGRCLKPIKIAEKYEPFLSSIPGKVGLFSDGTQTIVCRWILQPSRLIHPATDCFRAVGYSIEWLPKHVDSNGQGWSCFVATRGTERLTVREQIFDQNNHSWTDISAWYWAAMLQQTKGPWWSYSVSRY